MKNTVLIGLLVWLAVFSTPLFSQSSQDRDPNTIRLMSYNIRNGLGLDGRTDYARVARAISRLAPDVVAVEEVDSVTARSSGTDVLRILAEETCLYRTYAPAIDYDGGRYGIGLLSKQKPLRVVRIALPGREESRTLLVAEFDRYVYGVTHLSLTPEDQLLSLPLIRAAVGGFGKPVFLAGDFNATPDSKTMEAFGGEFAVLSNPKQNTFPADGPDQCIDYIVARKADTPRFTVLGSWVIDEKTASDHRPVVVDVKLKTPASAIFRTRPYLQNPVGNGVTVMWHTTVPANSWVEYGTDTTNLTKKQTLVNGQAICNGYLHKIRLEGLEPGRKYYYRVVSQEITLYQAYKKEFGETAVSGFSSFTLPAVKNADFTAVIFNDIHNSRSTLDVLYKQVENIPYDFVVCNGDIIDAPHTADPAVDFIDYVNRTVGADRIPVIYLRGNHEIRDAYSMDLKDQFDYIGGQTYSAFNWGDTRFVLLDCGEDKPDDHWVYYGLNDFTGFRADQAAFLKKEVASKAFRKSAKRVLIHHIPIYGKTDRYNPCRELWGDILSKAPFDVSLNAHTHRFAYYPKGSVSNNYPVVVGGGYNPKGATVMVLRKQGKTMTLQVLNANGETLLNLNL